MERHKELPRMTAHMKLPQMTTPQHSTSSVRMQVTTGVSERLVLTPMVCFSLFLYTPKGAHEEAAQQAAADPTLEVLSADVDDIGVVSERLCVTPGALPSSQASRISAAQEDPVRPSAVFNRTSQERAVDLTAQQEHALPSLPSPAPAAAATGVISVPSQSSSVLTPSVEPRNVRRRLDFRLTGSAWTDNGALRWAA